LSNKEKPKHQDKVEALDSVSLGISIVVAILIGIAIGLGLKSWTGYSWTLWIGVAWGIAAAILNVYKAYKKIKKSYDDLAQEPRYKYEKEHGINKIDDE
jgi:F0F1-type ATP synthase assembly protein I